MALPVYVVAHSLRESREGLRISTQKLQSKGRRLLMRTATFDFCSRSMALARSIGLSNARELFAHDIDLARLASYGFVFIHLQSN